ncbi:MAG TPA: ATP-binding protein [Solirubrobacteraceae bacterium]|nr:ATP-binding protein [Solirubrobacteraceae bacterium]
MSRFVFSALPRFVNRDDDIKRLEDWWRGSEPNALAMYGRRRVGKSWLFRRFAHDKDALVLVADRRAQGPQLDRFAEHLEPHLRVRPALKTVPDLIEALYALADDDKLLVVIDEFPYLLPQGEADRDEVLTGIQRVMEERDASKLKLVLCGSYIGQMERLLSGPLRGRLTAMVVDPLHFTDAHAYMDDDTGAVEAVERYAVAGGMSLYLDELGRGSTLRERICERVLDPRGPLFNDPREVLDEELRTPGTYYSLLEELSTGKKSLADMAAALGRRTTDIQGYLRTLREMRIIDRAAPVTARDEERNHRYSLADDFMRFWFRFVLPFQEDLKAGLAPTRLYDVEIADQLADHVSPTFEALCRQFTLQAGAATRIGSWWGNALNEHRRSGLRQTEEIDVVGLSRGVVSIVGECKWTSREMPHKVLSDLEQYKLPALGQASRIAKSGPQIVLFSKSGFDAKLQEDAAARDDLRLVDVREVVGELLAAR